MMGHQTSTARRRLKAAGVAGPLLAGVAVTLMASPAVAATGITSPSDGARFTDASTVAITANVEGLPLLTDGRLQLRGPTDDGFTTVDSGQGTLSYGLPLGGADPAYNGRYTVRLDVGTAMVLRSSQGKRTFTVRVPPRRPSGLEASVRGDRRVRLQWDRGPEPDLVSYDVLTSAGQKLRDGLSVGTICGSTLCTTTVTAPSGAGGTVGFAVRAHRSTAPGSAATVASAPSGVDTVTLASPSPSPSVSASGSSAGVGAAATTGHTRRPRLKPLSSDSPSSVRTRGASPANLPPVGTVGTDGQGFSAPLPSVPSETPAGGGGAASQATTWTAVTDTAQRWKTAAVIVIVLLVAAHLGGLHWRGRAQPAAVRLRAPRSATAAYPVDSATTAPQPGLTDVSGISGGITGTARRRGTRRLRRVRSLVGAYRGRRRRFD